MNLPKDDSPALHAASTSGRPSLFPALQAFADDALEVICDECGFDPDESAIYQFRRSITEEDGQFGVEFRFIGSLGFGGKFHLHSRSFRWPSQPSGNDYRCYVSCYPEDKTPEREAMIAAANERLSKIADKYAEAFSRGE